MPGLENFLGRVVGVGDYRSLLINSSCSRRRNASRTTSLAFVYLRLLTLLQMNFKKCGVMEQTSLSPSAQSRVRLILAGSLRVLKGSAESFG
jgi:hypothetical protein